MTRKAILTALLIGIVIAGSASAADSLPLKLVSQTSTSITLGWTADLTGYGYLFSADGKIVSRTNDAARKTVTFSKGAKTYEVATLLKGASGSYPPPGPAAPASLTATAITQTGLTVVWAPVVGATNYRIFRGTTQIGQGPGSSGGYADVWADKGLTCGTLYTYSVDAQNANGTSPKTTLDVATLACDQPPPTEPPPTEPPPTEPPPTGGTTLTTAQFQSACAQTGATIDNVTVNGSGTVRCTGQNVTIRNSRLNGFNLEPNNSGIKFLSSSLTNGKFGCYGADNGLIENSTLDGGGRGTSASSNAFEDYPAGNGCQHWVIRGNTIKNYHGSDCSVHAEGLRIGGYANDFLVENNRFENNGCTSHIFFTYWGAAGSAGYNSAQLPKNVCVRGNDFGPLFAQTFVDINFRQEINQAGPGATNIRINPAQNASTTNAAFNIAC